MYIVFDIGGTNMRIAASRDLSTLTADPLVEKTPRDFSEGVARIGELARELCGGEPVIAAGGGIAGPLNRERTMLVDSPHNPGWIQKPFADELSKIVDAPVVLENDAAVVGLGEAHFGAGSGKEIVAYLTVSTGVGGARIVDGRIDVSRFGFEPGHQIIDLDGSACPQSTDERGAGKLGGYISGTAVEMRYGRPPYEVEDEAEWHTLAKWLSYGLANTIVHWSPDIIVLGGSMIVKRPGISVDDVGRHLRETLTIFPECPEVVEAKCGDFGGVWGALELIRQRIEPKM